MPTSVALLFATLCLGALACSRDPEEHHLRGKSSPSPDGLTYLLIDRRHAPSPGCALYLNGERWESPHVPTRIKQGTQGIAQHCPLDGESPRLEPRDAPGYEFDVPQGSTFRFDYWGP